MLLPEESLSRKFITKWAWIYFFIILTAPLGYITRIILTGDLTPSEVGIIYGTISLLGLLGMYSDFWLTESLNYFLPKYILKNDFGRVKYLMFITLLTQIITSILVTCCLYFWAEWIGRNYFHTEMAIEVIQIISLYFIGSHLLTIITTFLNAIQNIKIQKTIDFIRLAIVTLWSSILFFSDLGNIITYSWMWISWIYVALIFWSIIFFYLYYKNYLLVPVIHDSTLKKIFIQYSLGTLFSANVATLLHQIDMQFITYFLWVHDTGIYSIYLSLIGIPFIFLGPIIAFLFPVISEIWGREDKKKIGDLFRIFWNNMSLIILWMSFIFIIAWTSIAWFLFGKDFLPAGTALYFIAPFLIFNILMQIQFQILWGLGYIKKRITILLWGLLFNISLSLICILGYKYNIIPFPNGSSAASFAVGTSWILIWYLSYRATKEYIIGFAWKHFFVNILVWGIFICIFYQVRDILIPPWDLTGRIYHLFVIGFALLSSLIIFLVVNRTQINLFIQTVKKVRNGSL